MTRRYRIATPAGPVEIVAARAVIEHGGTLALYGAPGGAIAPSAEHSAVGREALIAAFAPGGWLSFEIADD